MPLSTTITADSVVRTYARRHRYWLHYTSPWIAPGASPDAIPQIDPMARYEGGLVQDLSGMLPGGVGDRVSIPILDGNTQNFFDYDATTGTVPAQNLVATSGNVDLLLDQVKQWNYEVDFSNQSQLYASFLDYQAYAQAVKVNQEISAFIRSKLVTPRAAAANATGSGYTAVESGDYSVAHGSYSTTDHADEVVKRLKEANLSINGDQFWPAGIRPVAVITPLVAQILTQKAIDDNLFVISDGGRNRNEAAYGSGLLRNLWGFDFVVDKGIPNGIKGSFVAGDAGDFHQVFILQPGFSVQFAKTIDTLRTEWVQGKNQIRINGFYRYGAAVIDTRRVLSFNLKITA